MMTRQMGRTALHSRCAALCILLGACATGLGPSGSSTGATPANPSSVGPGASWPTATHEHVDFWLRLFVQSLADENTRFYQSYWSGEQAARAATRQAVDSVWQRLYRLRLQRFLNNTQQSNGELILSLPLDGEGRTVAYSKQQNLV